MLTEQKKKVSIVIPTIEEEGVFGLIGELRQMLGNETEFVIVDKSGDEYYKKLLDTGAIVIRQKDNGVENAIMLGLKHASGDILASIDADGTHDPSGIKAGVELIEEGKADMVLGNRLANLEKGSMSGYLKFGNSVLSWIFSKLYKTEVHDVLTGLFVMSRESFEDIKGIDPYRAGIAFFALEVATRGYRIKEVDIKYYKRRYGTSKLTKSKFLYGLNVGSHFVRKIRDYSPLLIFGSLGLVLILIGVILGLFILANFVHTGLLGGVGRALLSFMFVVLGFVSIVTGFTLDLLLEIDRKLSRRS